MYIKHQITTNKVDDKSKRRIVKLIFKKLKTFRISDETVMIFYSQITNNTRGLDFAQGEDKCRKLGRLPYSQALSTSIKAS